MNTDAFKKAYGEPRNGANQFFRHGLARNFVFSDGVNDCANAGCRWWTCPMGSGYSSWPWSLTNP